MWEQQVWVRGNNGGAGDVILPAGDDVNIESARTPVMVTGTASRVFGSLSAGEPILGGGSGVAYQQSSVEKFWLVGNTPGGGVVDTGVGVGPRCEATGGIL